VVDLHIKAVTFGLSSLLQLFLCGMQDADCFTPAWIRIRFHFFLKWLTHNNWLVITWKHYFLIIMQNTLHCGSKNVNLLTTAIIPDLDNIWQKYCQRNLHSELCTFTYYLIVQLGTSLCCHSNWLEEVPSPGTHGGKLHRAWFVLKNCCVSTYAGCWLHFLHRWKNFHGSSTSQQSKWLHVCSRDYHDVTSLPTNSYVPAWLSVNHWWYQLLSQAGLLGSGVCGPWHKD